MNSVIENLLTEAPVITDGAWGTELQARGLPIGTCPDPWNIEQPENVEAVARSYADAGSRIILTNTFGATRIALARYDLADRAAEINREGARISRRAAAPNTLVFASMGPTGAMLAMGDVSEADVAAAFEEQAAALAEGGAQGLVIETISDLDEAVIAVTAARKTGLPVVACMAYGSGKDGDRTMMGVTPEAAARGLEAAGADVIGANCGPSATIMRGICARLKAETNLPIWMKPNAGAPQLVDGVAVSPMTAEEFVVESLAMIEAGTSFIGGCCGSKPGFIRALAAALSEKRRCIGL